MAKNPNTPPETTVEFVNEPISEPGLPAEVARDLYFRLGQKQQQLELANEQARVAQARLQQMRKQIVAFQETISAQSEQLGELQAQVEGLTQALMLVTPSEEAPESEGE